jgi:hypothetical protein
VTAVAVALGGLPCVTIPARPLTSGRPRLQLALQVPRASQPRVPEATDAQCLAWLIVLCVVFASCITRRPAMALCSLHGCVLEMMVTVRIVGACLCGLSGGWDGRSLAGMRTSRPLQMLALHQR